MLIVQCCIEFFFLMAFSCRLFVSLFDIFLKAIIHLDKKNIEQLQKKEIQL